MVARNDHFWIGLLVSFAVAGIAYFLFIQLGEYFSGEAGRVIAFKPRTMALLAICLNVLPLNVFRRTYRSKSIKGLVTGVMVMAVAWFFYYGRDLLNGE